MSYQDNSHHDDHFAESIIDTNMSGENLTGRCSAGKLHLHTLRPHQVPRSQEFSEMGSDLQVLRVVWQGLQQVTSQSYLKSYCNCYDISFRFEGLNKITLIENIFQTPDIQTWSWKIHWTQTGEAKTRQRCCSAQSAWTGHVDVVQDSGIPTSARPSRIEQTNVFSLRNTVLTRNIKPCGPDPESLDLSYSPRLQSSVSLRPQLWKPLVPVSIQNPKSKHLWLQAMDLEINQPPTESKKVAIRCKTSSLALSSDSSAIEQTREPRVHKFEPTLP